MKNLITKYDLIISNKLATIKSNLLITLLAKSGNHLVLLFIIVVFALIPSKTYKIMAIISGVSLAINMSMVLIVKIIFKRERRAYENKLQQNHDPYSFPSGHVARLSSLIIPTIAVPILSLTFGILSLLCGISRIIRRYHYFFDCVIGFLIGGLGGLIAWLFSQTYINIFIAIYKMLHLWV